VKVNQSNNNRLHNLAQNAKFKILDDSKIIMPTIISKFGGTSVSSKNTWDNIVQIAKKHIEDGLKPVLVCSARSKASNMLEELIDLALKNQFPPLLNEFKTLHFDLANELGVPSELIAEELNHLEQWLTGIALLKHIPAKTHAAIMSLGELMSTKLGHRYLEQSGLNALWYDARLAIHTEDHSHDEKQNYCQARCTPKANLALQKEFSNIPQQVIITQGFIGSNALQETVILGRGGSDTSAALFAAILDAQKCEIWTDVPGIYTANPHQLPQARLLKQLNYDEAQEISSMGAKVLHPLAIAPVRQAQIPMAIKYTWNPDHAGTLITLDSDIDAPPVKSIQIKSSITVISLDTSSMWQQAGFLAKVFNIFAKHHFSINLISTAECNVTLSLDGQAHPRPKLQKLIDELNQICKAKLIEPCSSISLIGHHIRRILPQLGPSFELFNDQQIHLMSLASNDLSLNIVVDESKADRMTQQLHQLLIDNNPQSYYYSKSWQEEFNPSPEAPKPWWLEQKDDLITFAEKHAPCYVYNPHVLIEKIHELKKIKSISQIFYALKANANSELLKIIYDQGLNFECVSQEEIQKILKLFPQIDRKRILFTPNFAHKKEYEFAIQEQVILTIDSLYPLKNWRKMLAHQSVLLRIDPGIGAGHHKYVSTSGDESKFGITIQDIPKAKELILQNDIHIMGLHAHAGSGILSAQLWPDTAKLLLSLIKDFPDIKVIDLGGGLGIVERPGQQPLDLDAIETQLFSIKKEFPQIELWLEPGRILVAECGVLLARATQEKTKNKVRFVGIEVGMNSLIRPALYGSYHHIVNLSRIDDQHKSFAHVVGPICESSDTLGYDRMLPQTVENDIMLIATTGAYGYCMSSHYNLRQPAKEMIFQEAR
jgi:diaminopimelate decarboxylase/aspartate kinase